METPPLWHATIYILGQADTDRDGLTVVLASSFGVIILMIVGLVILLLGKNFAQVLNISAIQSDLRPTHNGYSGSMEFLHFQSKMALNSEETPFIGYLRYSGPANQLEFP